MHPLELLNTAAFKGQLAHLLLFHGGSSMERTKKGLD
ncbi:MAG: DNA polymerase III subunit delta', partial [Desulfitobacterium sp.]|nr:DNA polymerase III subunit delta' [Desulfitobacterium sp.]